MSKESNGKHVIPFGWHVPTNEWLQPARLPMDVAATAFALPVEHGFKRDRGKSAFGILLTIAKHSARSLLRRRFITWQSN